MTQQQGAEDNTQRIAGLMRAKSGRAVGGADASQSNLGEQSAVAATNQGLGQVQQAANIQNQGLEQTQLGQQSSQNAQEQGIAQNRTFDNIQSRLKTDQIIADLERDNGQLDSKTKDAQIVQVAQNLRLQSQQYTDQLQRQGDTARLSNEAAFKEETARTAFGENQLLLEKLMGNQSIVNANARDFDIAMENMGLDASYAMFRNNQIAAAQTAQISGAGSVVTAGIGVWSENKAKDTTPDKPGGQSVKGDNPIFQNEPGYVGGRN